MSNANGKILEFFAKISKLEADESNWVIFKDRFMFAAAAASLIDHIDGTGTVPSSPVTCTMDSGALTEIQQEALDEYAAELSRWRSGEAIIRQAIASTISDSLFLEVRKRESAKEMWDAVRDQREKKSRMVTVDMRRKLQAEKCPESGDIRAHLYKLQAMREDLASMGGSISDEDFTSIILGSIPQSYDTYIAAITATSTLLNQTLSPTNLIDTIRDEADRRTIKNPKSKKNEQDAAYVAGQSFGRGKKEGEELKKSKKDAKCYNCKKKRHFARDCWAPGGGAEGKGPKSKGKGKEKEVVAKVDENGERNSDAAWMVLIGDEVVDEIDDKVASWLQDISRRSGGGYELWTEDEIVADEFDEQASTVNIDYSPMSTESKDSEHSIFDVSDLVLGSSVTSVGDEAYADSLPDLMRSLLSPTYSARSPRTPLGLNSDNFWLMLQPNLKFRVRI